MNSTSSIYYRLELGDDDPPLPCRVVVRMTECEKRKHDTGGVTDAAVTP